MLSHFSAFYCSFVVMRWNTKNHQDDKQLTLVYSYSLHLYRFGLSRTIFQNKDDLHLTKYFEGLHGHCHGQGRHLTKLN